LRARERDAVLRPARTGERGLDVAEVELDNLRVPRVLAGLVPEEVLVAVRLDERDALLGAAGEAQVVDRRLVDGEEATRGAVLRRHVPERCAVGDRQSREPRAEV